MPGDEARTACFFDEKIRGPAEQVRTQDVFGSIDDAWVAHDLVDPSEKQVRLVPPIALQWSSRLRLVRLQAVTIACHLGLREGRERKVVAVAIVGLDDGIGQHFGHRLSSNRTRTLPIAPASLRPQLAAVSPFDRPLVLPLAKIAAAAANLSERRCPPGPVNVGRRELSRLL